MNKFVIFMAGAAIGSVATLFGVKNHYEKKYQEDLDSVKASFSKYEEVRNESALDDGTESDISEDATLTSEVAQLQKKVDELGYGITADKEEVNLSMRSKRPYIVSPEEFGEAEGYDVASLIYYADHVLVDDQDELVEDVEGTVGFESLSHFGEYEDDTVFVRNDRLRCDFEIVKNLERYSDRIKTLPPRATLHGKK